MAASDKFDHQRLADFLAQPDLGSARARVTLMDLVMDYMTHLKAVKQPIDAATEEIERESAKRFLQLVNNDIAWPLAYQVVPEFQQVGGLDLTKYEYPLRYIMRSVEPRMTPPRALVPEGQKFEEDLLRRRIRHYIEYVAFLNGERHRASDEVVEQAEEAIKTMLSAAEDFEEIKGSGS